MAGTKEIDRSTLASPPPLRASVASSLRGFEPVPPRRDLELEALAEILAGQRLVHCHSYRQDEILMLCRIAKEFNFRIGTFQHILEGYKVADEIRESSGGGSAFSDWWAYKVEVQDAIPYDGAIMHDVGVVVSFNSDSDELARRMNVEAGKAVKYGNLSCEEALKFVTLNPAKQLQIDKQVGSLEVGKDADLAIWTVPSMGTPSLREGRVQTSVSSADTGKQAAAAGSHSNSGPGVPPGLSNPPTVDGTPLSAFARCEQTWVDGRCYFTTERDAAMRESNTRERNRLLQKLLATGPKKKEAGKDDAPKPSGDAPPGGRRRRPTDDLASGAFAGNMQNDPTDADIILDDESYSNGQGSLLQRMLKRSADARREQYLNLWRMGIDPTYSRCGDCGESNAGAMR
ncbi:MAG: amidohydrolase family protein [Pyrinomonadaceae bacterium]|nr:amidohydrolase family protein [Phycisphaerales bacterium]